MGTDSIHYQLYEMYYRKAAEAEGKGLIMDAKRLYILSSESLLKSARQADGEMKGALMERAAKIQKLSDLLGIAPMREQGEEPESAQETPIKGNLKAAGSNKPDGDGPWKSPGRPNVHFSDIAGLEDVKDSINRRIILPRKHPDLYKRFKRKMNGGILLYGPPGNGKTMIAKAIACEVDAAFFSVRCSDIVGKYFGESEKNIKSLFEAARKEELAVIFFDEFEALGAQRGGDSPVMNRLVPELLSQMDGFQAEEKDNVLFLAATNRPWDIDSAFLRPPRLTEKLYVGLPDEPARLYLMKQAFEGVPVSPSIDFGVLVGYTDGFNGADVASFCEAVKDSAIDRAIKGNPEREVIAKDIERAREKVRPSVRKRDLEMIRQWEREQQA